MGVLFFILGFLVCLQLFHTGAIKIERFEPVDATLWHYLDDDDFYVTEINIGKFHRVYKRKKPLSPPTAKSTIEFFATGKDPRKTDG